MVDAQWSEYDLKTLVRKIPKVSVGEAKAWVVAETRGTALNLTLKYTPPGERRGQNMGSSTCHPELGGKCCYGMKVFLARKACQYGLQEIEARARSTQSSGIIGLSRPTRY